MTEILLFTLSLSILGYHAWYVREHDKEVKMLTKALLAKDLTEFTQSEVKVGKKEPPKEEFVELKDLSDKQFDKLITNQINK